MIYLFNRHKKNVDTFCDSSVEWRLGGKNLKNKFSDFEVIPLHAHEIHHQQVTFERNRFQLSAVELFAFVKFDILQEFRIKHWIILFRK